MSKTEEKTTTDSHKVSLSWYPNDWKASDTFLDVDDPLVRYYYLEIIFLLYLNKGLWEISRPRFQKLMRFTIPDEIWNQVSALFETKELNGALYFSHKSVTKRIDKRSITSAENGASGGRPGGKEKPKNNLIQEPKHTLSKPKEPNSTIEDKIIQDKIIEPNTLKGYKGSMVSEGEVKPTLAPPAGGRFDLKTFGERAGVTFRDETRMKADKLWSKLTDQETKLATKWFPSYRLLAKEYNETPKLSEYLKGKPWVEWEIRHAERESRIRESEKNENDLNDGKETT